MTNVTVKVGDQVFVESVPANAFGAVREVAIHQLVVDVENYGEIRIPAAAVRSVHEGKVTIIDDHLPADIRQAIARAHAAEDQ